MSRKNSTNWLGAMSGGRMELTLPCPEVFRRVQEAAPGRSHWDTFNSDIGKESFALWMHKQTPKLRARVEPLGTGSLLSYEVVSHPAWLVPPALFSLLLLCAPVVFSWTAHDSTLLCLYFFLLPVGLVFMSLPILASRIACRALLNLLHRTFEDVQIIHK